MSRIFYVMGPSGAGKDAILRTARQRLVPADGVVFAHRYITRPPEANENHIALSEAEFMLRRERGLFAMDWAANGLRYGIGREVELWRDAGLAVVISGSREHYAAELAGRRDITPVLITAPSDVLQQRLSSRGREDQSAIAGRLERNQSLAGEIRHTVLNDGPLEAAVDRFLACLHAELAAA